MTTHRQTPSTASMPGWRTPQNVRWSLRNFGLLPSVMVPRGGGFHEFEKGPTHDVEAHRFSHLGKDYVLADAMAEDRLDGYIVIKDGKILYERYFGDFRQHDHHMWASMTKSLVATAFGIVVDRFGLDVSKTAAEFIPDLNGSAFGEASIRQVLNMVTALDYTEEYDKLTPGSVHLNYFRHLGMLPDVDLMKIDPLQSDEPRSVRSFLPQFRVRDGAEIGAVYEYQSPNVDVIGWLIEVITGQTLQDFITENIWSKLRTEHDAFMVTDAAFNPVATGGMNTTLRDAARFGMMALNEGEFAGERIAPAGWMKDSYTLNDQDKAAGAASVFRDKNGERYYEKFEGYRNFWWVIDSERGERTAMGVHGQTIFVNSTTNTVICSFASPDLTGNAIRPSFKKMFAGTISLANSL